NDTIYGEGGNDLVAGDEGSDTLYGGNGDDTLLGGSGNDVLYAGDGDDTLDGGAGDDLLYSGAYRQFSYNYGNYAGNGNDTYRFGVGDGHDTIYDVEGAADRVTFKEGVATADVRVTRSGNAMVLSIAGTTDTLTVLEQFSGDASTQIEEVRFADEPLLSWSVSDLMAKSLLGTSNADTLVGFAGDDVIHGAAGNDTLYGEGGNDLIAGDEGNDTLYGGNGDDVLLGGVGDDVLVGGADADSYAFASGGGQDLIVDSDATSGVEDTLQFGTGISADQLWMRQVGNDLEVSVIGTSDKVTIADWYSGTSHQIETFEVASGLQLVNSSVNSLVEAMAAFSPPAAGETTLPTSYQTSLNGVIAANWQ
ncbi:MAG: RTX toxin, partial [Burkholderiales bacterium]